MAGIKRYDSYTKSQIRTAYIFLLPGLLGFLVFVLYPVIASFVLVFLEWDGLTEMKFVGLDNYARLFKDETFKISLFNNLHYTGVTVPITITFAIFLALAMNTKVKGIGVFRVLYYLPNITAPIAIGIIWVTIFASNGPLNSFLRFIGMKQPPGWLNSSDWALIAVEIVAIWRSMGYYAIILLAGLQGIPGQLYEAADIDGANWFYKFRKITIPMLSPTIFFCIVMNIIGSFQVFDTIMAMTQGGPGRATNVLVYNIYRMAFQQWKFGYASAMAYVMFVIILFFTLIQFRWQNKWVNY